MKKAIILNLRRVAGSFLMMCLLSSIGYGQTKLVSGIIKEEGGQGLPGVNVLVKGTPSGTISNGEGKYKDRGLRFSQ